MHSREQECRPHLFSGDRMEEHRTAPDGETSAFSFFSPGQWVFYGLLLVAGLLLRWISLDYMPLHHDESIHAMFGQYFYDFPEIQYYKYDPEYHGPTLYMLLRLMYASLGSSDVAARAPIALLGSLAILVPFVFRRYLAPVSVLYLTAAVALSPSLIYWSRFVREDYIIFFGMFLVLYGATLARPATRAFFILNGIALNWATKANIFVFLGILAGYLVFEYGFSKLVLKREDSLAGDMFSNLKTYPSQAVGAFISAAFVFTYLITSGYRHLKGIGDGLGVSGVKYFFLSIFNSLFGSGSSAWQDAWKDAKRSDVLLYWIDKHNIERIQGPFNFHLYELSWYEFLFICVFLAHVVLFYKFAPRLVRNMAIGAGVLMAILLVYYGLPTSGFSRAIGHIIPFAKDLTTSHVWKFFKAKDALDVAGVVFLVTHAILVTVTHLWRRQYALGFFGYFFTASLFSYSYLGEKVPWLSSYPLLAGFAYLPLFFQDCWREHPIVDWKEYPLRRVILYAGVTSFLLGVVFFLEGYWSPQGESYKSLAENAPYLIAGLVLGSVTLLDIYLNILGTCNLAVISFLVLCIFNVRIAILTNFPGKEKEMGYISQVHTTFEFKDTALAIRKNIEQQVFGLRPLVHVDGEASWPITWYFRGLPEYKFDKIDPAKRNQYAYLFDTWKDEGQEVPEGFVARRVNLRGWWVPEFKDMTVKKFLNYSFNLEAWSPAGYTYTRLLTNKKLLPAGPLLTVEGEK